MFDDLSLFINIVDCGSYSKATNKLNLYQSKISRRMKNLENSLGVSLFKKNTRKMELTDTGMVAYKMFKNSFSSLQNKLDDFSALNKAVCGEVKVILPPLFAKIYINNQISKFVSNYPEIKLRLSYLTANEEELNYFNNYDLIINHLPPSKPYHILRVLFESKLILVTTKNYIDRNNEIKNLHDLIEHKIITTAENEKQLLAYGENSHINQKISLGNGIINLNCWNATLDLLQLGDTMAFIPEFAIKAELKSGALTRVLPEFHFGKIKYYLIQANHETSMKHEIVKEFLYSCSLPENKEQDNSIKLHLQKDITKNSRLNLLTTTANNRGLEPNTYSFRLR
ncbi:LysR family transcriptional regulator [Aquella oligotrophica]|nr:LysR family transcriptional regulator [Aquella oligotrophica]